MQKSSRISHLLFADDTLLFFKADPQEAENIRNIILAYEGATGQLINPAKCSILFGKHCSEINKENVRMTLQAQLNIFEEK